MTHPSPVFRSRDQLRKLIVFILLAMIAAKVTAVVLRGPAPIERDALGYWHLSTLVMQGDVLLMADPIAYRTPFYPWFLATVRSFTGPYALWTLCLLQGGLALGAVAIAAHMAARITKLPLAMPCTLLAALPAVSSLTFCAAILSETLFVFLLMLNLLAVLDYCKYGSAGRAAWVGVTFWVALLTRPIILLLWIPHVIFVVAIQLRRRKRVGTAGIRTSLTTSMTHALIAAAVIGVLCAPWLLRNAYLFGQPMLTEFVGRNIWIVTFQDGSGAGFALPSSDASDRLQQRLDRVNAAGQWRSTWAVSNALVQSGLKDTDADRLMKQVAIDAIQTDPSRFAWKAFRRTVNFWRCAATELPAQGRAGGPYLGEVNWKQTTPTIEWLIEHRWSQSVIGNTVLLGLFLSTLLVLFINPTTRPYGLWLALILAYFCVVTGVLEIPAYRYRMVVEPIVSLVVGAGAAVMLSWRRREASYVGSA